MVRIGETAIGGSDARRDCRCILPISLGGDSDTLACIAGGIAEAYFGPLPAHLASEVGRRLPAELLVVVEAFSAKYGSGQSWPEWRGNL